VPISRERLRLPGLAGLVMVIACLLACVAPPGAGARTPPLLGSSFTSSVTTTTPGSAGITVDGRLLMDNGRAWVPNGVQITGLVAPDADLTGKYIQANAHFGAAEMQAAVADHVDLLRIQVSEFGLNPADPLYDPGYLAEIESGVALAESYGLNVDISLQAETPAGNEIRCALDDSGAATDWSELASAFAGDPNVMFELYNEPALAATSTNWQLWLQGGITTTGVSACTAVGVQSLVNEIRAVGADNVIILPGLSGEQSLAGIPKVTDPADPSDPQLAYGIHYPNLTQESTEWDSEFGNAAERHPVIVTEWQANSLPNSVSSCVANTPSVATLLMDYLASKDIGIVGFAIDLPGTIVADYNYTPTSFANFTCGVAGDGAGQLLFGNFAGEWAAATGSGLADPRAWMTDVGSLTRLVQLDGPLVISTLNTPRTYVQGASAPQLDLLGLGNAVPVATFTDESALAAATATGALPPGTGAVELDLGGASPVAQQRTPMITFELAANAAHRAGLLLIAAPQTSLITTVAPKTKPRDFNIAFLRRKLIASAATYANAVVVPFNSAQKTAGAYGGLAQAAALQANAVHPGIELMDGLSSIGATPAPSAALTASVAAADPSVTGYALTDGGVGTDDANALSMFSALFPG
jgi:endoglucanase